MAQATYIPALRFHWLTRFYDPIVAATTREAAFKPALIAHADLGSASGILDVGCGTGSLTAMASRAAPQARVVGLDADEQALRLAATKVGGLPIELVRSDASALPFRDAEFDRVISSLFFHHLTREKKLAVLRECRRVLAPSGTLTFADWGKPATFTTAALFSVVRILDGFEPTADNAAGTLPDLCRASGFSRVAELQSFNVPLGTITVVQAYP